MEIFTATDIRGALKEGMARMRAAEVPSSTLAAELLLMHALDCDRTRLYAHSEDAIDASTLKKYFDLLARRAAGEPTQYLTGKQEFWGLEFEVNPAVLIPRPETEHVIEVALERLGSRGIKIDMKSGARSPRLRVADVGTGSGCIAVALTHELPHADVVATDISRDALTVAARNAQKHGVADRIQFIEADLLTDVLQEKKETGGEGGIFDVVVSNPPYIAQTAAPVLQREVRDHEPHAALFGGASGFEIYARLIAQTALALKPGGILVLELGYDSAKSVREMLSAAGAWVNIAVTNDLAGIPRVL